VPDGLATAVVIGDARCSPAKSSVCWGEAVP